MYIYEYEMNNSQASSTVQLLQVRFVLLFMFLRFNVGLGLQLDMFGILSVTMYAGHPRWHPT